MSQTKSPDMTRSPISREIKHNQVDKSKSQSAIFISLALDMTWRLAFVVLIPIVGGYELDKKLNSAPGFLILGLVISTAGVILVLKRTLKVVEKRTK